MTSSRSIPRLVRVLILLAFWVTIAVILAGSIVRTTGSGLGCPDWPKCFGHWVPPSSITELPLDYKTRFQIAGKEISDFDAFKTWTEYLNRLAGVLLGIVLLALSIVTIVKRKRIPSNIFWSAQGALLLVVLQGGLGALVVATHLHRQAITLHLGLALALAVLLKRMSVAVQRRNFFGHRIPSAKWKLVGRLVYMLAAIQLFMGTEVRKTIDNLVHEFVSMPRDQWALHLDWNFLIHRSLSLVFVLMSSIWFWLSLGEGLRAKKGFPALAAIVVGSIFTGVVMRELGFPAWAQPLHLVFGVLMFVQVDRIYRQPTVEAG